MEFNKAISASFSDMIGGLLVGELALQLLVGSSKVASGYGLYVSLDDSDDDGAVEEVVLPQGTPLCGYARGYFSDKATGDKSVFFSFQEGNSGNKAVFYNKQLVSLSDAVRSLIREKYIDESKILNEWIGNILWAHFVKVGVNEVIVKPDDSFKSIIFIPDIDDENSFGATSIGVYANDLAFDPDATQDDYDTISNSNNILQLIWRLAKDENREMLVPTWPVVVAKNDCRFLNSIPMEVGLQYGYKYWEAAEKEGLSKYIT